MDESLLHGWRAVKLEGASWLFRADPARCDVGLHVYLRAHRRIVLSSQDGDLTDVRQGVGNRALKQLLRRDRERCVGGQITVERQQGGMKSINLLAPRAGLRRRPIR